jgi:uncharacterized Zn-binding protein involved in type VI secretion
MPPAARLSDFHTCPMATPGTPPVPHVGGPIMPPCYPQELIDDLPCARVGDQAVCVGPMDSIMLGSPTVYWGKKMAARMGDPTVHGGVITTGSPDYEIGGPVATVVMKDGKMIVTWGSMTIKGSPEDVQHFCQILQDECSRSDAARNRVAKNTQSSHKTSLTLVRDEPDIRVDSYQGDGEQTINMDYFPPTPGSFPGDPPPDAPYANTGGQNLVHALAEVEKGKEMADDYRAKHNGKDPPEGYGYDTSHKKGIQEENNYRKDRGQGSSVVSSEYDKGDGSTYTIKNSDGSSETHTVYEKPPKTTYNPPPGKKK